MSLEVQPFATDEVSHTIEQPLWQKFLKHGIIPLLVFAGAIVTTVWLLQTAPQSKRRKHTKEAATRIEFQRVKKAVQRVVIEAMGTVIPARDILLYPRVRGQIVSIDKELQPGGMFLRGRVLMRIDPIDYRLAFQQRQHELARTEAELQVEMGKQWIAEREFKMLGKKVPQKNRALMLRYPQLAIAKAAVQIAKAALEKARVDLNHTALRTPFDAVVASVDVNRGSQVTETTRLVRLVGTSEYWVVLSVSVDQLRWFSIPTSSKQRGALVRIYNPHAWGHGIYRIGRIIRLNPNLETQGRMAQVLVSISDPLAQKTLLPNGKDKAPRLLLDSYVQAQIDGSYLPPVATVSNEHLHDGHVWIMDEKNRLEIRKVRVLFRGPEYSYISEGLQEGEKLVTSVISIPVAGMLLRPPSRKTRGKTRRNTPSGSRTEVRR